MLAPFRLPNSYAQFNRRHHAPDGRLVRKRLRRFGRSRFRLLLAGPYAWQSNNHHACIRVPVGS